MISANQLDETTVTLSWVPSFFSPIRTSTVTQYIIYTATHYDTVDASTNPLLLASTSRIMNTVCGLKENTDHPYSIATCDPMASACTANITGLTNCRSYIFNVIVDSSSGLQAAYSGIIMKAEWDTTKLVKSQDIVDLTGIVIGSVLVILVSSYLVIYLKYT